MKWFNSKFTIGTISVIAAVAALIWYQQQPASALDASAESNGTGSVVLQSVRVLPVNYSDSAVMPQRYTATVVARRTSQLSFQATERVDEIFCDEGDHVTRGQLLARQDQAAILAQYNAAVARSEQTGAVLAELEKGPRAETIEAARSELERLKAQFNLAESTFRRQSNLRQSNASSEQEYDAARFDSAASKAAVATAQQKLDELVAGTRKEQIDAQRGALGVIQATVEQAKTRLDQTELFTPFSGRISKRFIDEGSLPQRGTPVLEIVETDHLEVRFGVSPSIAKQLAPGKKLTFSSGDQQHIGTVKQIQPTLDRSTRTRQVIATITDSDQSGLVDGQTVSVEFAIRSSERGFWVPTEALQPQVRGLWSVLVANDSPGNTLADEYTAKAQRRDVEVLATWGTWSRVRGTLEEFDNVIVQGANRVSLGQLVSATHSELTFPWQTETTIKLGSLQQESDQ
ncbi:efflux RND transporter periplasmic adaptor subunit [Mariniblastus fucicola]|uniref:Efflux pump periplasmic linker BepF n=1 Tax=Mariniblastus fucicola TaxID=980251 RepID=A0A5B9PHH8_9BACT|nr:efflux RND transporter periplasmic adaptor subunit [Mariniblastus fucicola]QEG24725.1 Efflux pump periplasmic linker BepF [Mariniblastus fucicola]